MSDTEIINITIAGETYVKYKEAYESIQSKKHAIDFQNENFFSYGWTFYTEEEALNEMAEKYKFMFLKVTEQYNKHIYELEEEISKLKQIPDN